MELIGEPDTASMAMKLRNALGNLLRVTRSEAAMDSKKLELVTDAVAAWAAVQERLTPDQFAACCDVSTSTGCGGRFRRGSRRTRTTTASPSGGCSPTCSSTRRSCARE